MKTFLFNPYTGTPRHPSDIASDPEGILIVDPEATTLEAYKAPTVQPERKPMTRAQIIAAWNVAVSRWGAAQEAAIELCDAFERHHGITGEKL